MDDNRTCQVNSAVFLSRKMTGQNYARKNQCQFCQNLSNVTCGIMIEYFVLVINFY